MKKISLHFLLLVVVSFIIASCRKTYDHPPLKDVNEGARISISRLKERIPTGQAYSHRLKGDTNLYCTVTSDELSGNFYQQVFVRDDDGGAIQLNLKESGGLYTGDRIRINLNNLYLVSANSMIWLDSADVTKNIVKLSSGNTLSPKLVSLDAILQYSANPSHSLNLQSQLVQISGVEFRTNTLTPTFADAIGKTSVNQVLSSCENGKSLTLRTSGRANFASKTLPKGNGTITGILSQYNTTMQLTLRDYKDVSMNGPLCATVPATITPGIFLLKDFNDLSVTSGGWVNYSVVNAFVNWLSGTSSLTPSAYARISGYVNGNTNAETWLISPAINITGAKDPVLSFRSAAKFSGPVLDVMVSVNYASGAPNTATWTSLSPAYVLSPSSGDYLWTPSGYVSLSAYRSTVTRIAFVYRSTTAGAASYQLDDIIIREK